MTNNQLNIFYGNKPDLIENITPLTKFLSIEEIDRSKKFVFDKDKNVYILSHGMLNKAISDELELDFSQLEIRYFDNKKPYIKGYHLDFNLSHSDVFFAYVIASSNKMKVGIDIEKIKKMEINSIVDEYMHPQEKEYIYSAKMDFDKRIRFYEIWTRKEAYLKLFGVGITVALENINVSPQIANYRNQIEKGDKGIVYINTLIRNGFVLSVATNCLVQPSYHCLE